MEKQNPFFTSISAEWYTPRWLVLRFTHFLGGIDLDPCSNSKAYPNVPAARILTAEDDGLACSWYGKVYMNPPYGRAIENWVDHLLCQYAQGNVTEALALLPSRTETHWFQRLQGRPVCFLKRRVQFIKGGRGRPNAGDHAGGPPAASSSFASAPFPSALVYLGPDVDRFAEAFGPLGMVLTKPAVANVTPSGGVLATPPR